MRILFIGDIFAKAGRRAIIEILPSLKQREKIDLVIANGENTTHGRSLNIQNFQQLCNAGIDIFTMGNHTFDNADGYETIKKAKNIVRPFNIEHTAIENSIGTGSLLYRVNNKLIRITNLVSTSCFNRFKAINPFLSFEQLISLNKQDVDIHIVDFHGDRTSEKRAFLLAYSKYLSAVLGTHTHVQTADEHIHNKKTFFITDVGMTGPINGIIGAKPNDIIELFQEKRERFKMKPATGKYIFNAVILEFDDCKNLPKSIKRINIKEK